jgi:hypothetical protein
MGLLASAVDDGNAASVDVYNAFPPATAQGAGLSLNVQINGIQRDVPTNSSVPVLIVGVGASVISNGQFSDPAGNTWALPASVTIPFPAGQIAVSATCQTQGAIQLALGLTTGGMNGLTILNPQMGWQTVTTTSSATPGAPVETDAQLRVRQAQSTQIPASTMLAGIVGAVLEIPGVETCVPYQNETDAPDSNGAPGYSIYLVIQGGNALTIAQTIQQYKFGCGTWGTTSETVYDAVGVGHVINFFFATVVPIGVGVTIAPGPLYATSTAALIQQSMAAWINSLGTGNNVQQTRGFAAAYLAPILTQAAAALQAAVAAGNQGAIATALATFNSINLASSTYEVTALTLAVYGNTLEPADVVMAFNDIANIIVDVNGNPVNPLSVIVTI